MFLPESNNNQSCFFYVVSGIIHCDTCTLQPLDDTYDYKMPSKRKVKKVSRCYALPEDIESAIQHGKPLNEVLKVVEQAKQVWGALKELSGGKLSRNMLERNLVICSAWYGHVSLIDYILRKWSMQHMADKRYKRDSRRGRKCLEKVLYLPLCLASFHGHKEVVRVLLQYVSRLSQEIPLDPVHNLMYWSRPGFCFPDILLAHTGISVWDMALCGDQVDIVEDLENHYYNKSSKKRSDSDIHYYLMLFYRACHFGSENCVRYLLNGKLFGFKNFDKLKFKIFSNLLSPLMVAAQSSPEVCQLLLDIGVPVNDVDRLDKNALHYAVLYKFYHDNDIVSAQLIEIDWYSFHHVVDVSEVFRYNLIDCHIRKLDRKHIEIIKLLIAHGVDKLHTCRFTLNALSEYDHSFQTSIFKIAHAMSPLLLSLLWMFNADPGRLIRHNKPLDTPSDAEIFKKGELMVEMLSLLDDPQMSCIYPNSPVILWTHILRTLLRTDQFLNSGLFCEDGNEDSLKTVFQNILVSLQLFLRCLDKLVKLKCISTPLLWENFSIARLLGNLIEVCQVNKQCQACYSVCRGRELASLLGLQVAPVIKNFLNQLLITNYKAGTKFSFDREAICVWQNIANVARRKDLLFCSDEVLSLLYSLPHSQYYKVTPMFNCSDGFFRVETQEGANNESKKTQPKEFLLAIKAMSLDQNPRPLTHIARLAVYGAFGRKYDPTVLDTMLPSKSLQSFLTEFSFL